MAKYDLLAIGELNVDMIVTGLKSMPVIGREIIADDFTIVLGSSTAICASGVACLGLKTGFVGKIGKDKFGDVALDGLKKNNIDTSEVIIDGSINTGVTVSLSTAKDRALVTYLGSIEALTLEDINMKLLENTRHIHVGSFFLQNKLRPQIPELFRLAHEKGITTSLDSGWDDSGQWDGGMLQALEHTDIFVPNEGEAMNLTKKANIREALEVLSQYAKIVVIKCGSEGAIGKWGAQVIEKAPFKVEPIDTTGAGDSFNAGFIYGFLKGFDLEKCLTYGNACGAISVTKIGGATSCATLAEVTKLIN